DEFDDCLDNARALLGSAESASDVWDANEHVNHALRLRSQSPDAWILKSQILSSLDDDVAALAAVEMALRRIPKCAEAHYVRAAILADLERYHDALRGIERALRCVHAEDEWLLEDIYYEKAAILDALDRGEEAMTTFQLGLKRCPESALLRS